MKLHSFVIRSASAFGRDPVDNLIRVGYVARFAVHAVRKIDFQLTPAGFGVFLHFINLGGAKTLARIAEFFGASGRADIRVRDVKMHLRNIISKAKVLCLLD